MLPDPEDYRILWDTPKLYVKGLYVCDLAHFKHGYNFSPRDLKLGRDRDVVSDFDLAYETSRMIAKQCTGAQIAQLALDPNYQDVAYVHAHIHLIRKDERTLLIGALSHMNTSSAKHSAQALMQGLGIALTTREAKMHDWLNQNKKHMRSKARKAFIQLAKELR